MAVGARLHADAIGHPALWDLELTVPPLDCVSRCYPVIPSTRLCRLFYIDGALVKVTRTAVEYLDFCIQVGSRILDALCIGRNVLLLLNSGEVACVSCSGCLARIAWRQRIMIPNSADETTGIAADQSGQYIAIMDGDTALYMYFDSGLSYCGRFRLPFEDSTIVFPRPMALTYDSESETGPLLWVLLPSRQPRVRVCSVTEMICTLPIDLGLGEVREIWPIRQDAVAICRKHGVTAITLSDALSGNTMGRPWVCDHDPQAYFGSKSRLYSAVQGQVLEISFSDRVTSVPISGDVAGCGSRLSVDLNGDSTIYEPNKSYGVALEGAIIDRGRLFTTSERGVSVLEFKTHTEEVLQEPCPPLNRLLWLDPMWLFLVTPNGTVVLEYDGQNGLNLSSSFSEIQSSEILSVGKYDQSCHTAAVFSYNNVWWYQNFYGKLRLLSVQDLPGRVRHVAVCFGLALVYIDNKTLMRIPPSGPPHLESIGEDINYIKSQSQKEIVVGLPNEVQVWTSEGIIRRYRERDSCGFAELNSCDDHVVCRKNKCATKGRSYEFCSQVEIVDGGTAGHWGSILGNDGEHLWLIGASGASMLSCIRKGPISAACVARLKGQTREETLVLVQSRGKLLAVRPRNWTSVPPVTVTDLRGPPGGSLSILRASLIVAAVKNHQIYLYDLRLLHRMRVQCTALPHKATLSAQWTFYSSDQERWEHLLVVDGHRLLSYSLSRVEPVEVLLRRRLKHELPTVPTMMTTNDDNGDIFIAKKGHAWRISVKVSQRSVEMGKWEEFTCPGEIKQITAFRNTAVVSTTRGTWSLSEIRTQVFDDRFRLAQNCATHYVGYIAGRTIVLVADRTVFLTAYEFVEDARFEMLMRVHGPHGAVKNLIPVNESMKTGNIAVLAILESDPEAAWRIEIDEKTLEKNADIYAIRPGLW